MHLFLALALGILTRNKLLGFSSQLCLSLPGCRARRRALREYNTPTW